jgi:hypothetical protein
MRHARWVGLCVVTLVLGVSGGVEAASLITGQQVKDDSVASIDIRNGSLSGRDVQDAGLGPDDYDRDITGDRGDDGSQGPPGFNGVHDLTYSQETVTLDFAEQSLQVNCPKPNQFAIAGGIDSDNYAELKIRASAPGGTGGTFARSWSLAVHSDFATPVTRTAYVVCVKATGPVLRAP